MLFQKGVAWHRHGIWQRCLKSAPLFSGTARDPAWDCTVPVNTALSRRSSWLLHLRIL